MSYYTVLLYCAVYGYIMLSTCYVSDKPWLASLQTKLEVFFFFTGLSELRGKKQQQQQQTIYNLAWRDAHARTTQELHLARTMRTPCRARSLVSYCKHPNFCVTKYLRFPNLDRFATYYVCDFEFYHLSV